MMIDSRTIFTARPWDRADGDPGQPSQVRGVAVIRCVCSRTDGAGALVALGDRRFALTGRTVAVGSPSQLRPYVRQRGRRPLGLDKRRWLDQVAERLAALRGASSGSLP
jgi:hypothetical protein